MRKTHGATFGILIIGSFIGGAGASTSSTSAFGQLESILPTDKFNESDVAEIVKNGFPRDRAIAELRTANGNKTQALAALFAKSLKFQ